MNYFITGTDTGVGKTFVTCLLLRALNATGRRAVGFKPICCGDRADVAALAAAGAGGASMDEINPLWFRTPASPLAATVAENRECDLQPVVKRFGDLCARFDLVLVEGAGGWEVPIHPDYFVSDLARDLGLPVIVVVRNRLGALNHAILTVNAIGQRGLPCAGLILNNNDADEMAESNRRILEQVLDVPILGEVRPDADQEAILPLVRQL